MIKIASSAKNNVSPQISGFKKHYFANLNTKFKLLCYLEDGDQPVQYTWRHNGKEIIKNDRISIEHVGDEAALKIDKVQFEDSGNYSCQAQNHVGSDVQSTILTVKGLILHFLVYVLILYRYVSLTTLVFFFQNHSLIKNRRTFGLF